MQLGCQIYVKGSVEAVAFYQNAFNLTIGMNFFDENGRYAHASLMSGENEVLAIAEDINNSNSHEIKDGKLPVMTFNCYGLGTDEAVQHAYNVLSEGAVRNENPNGPAPVPWSALCFTVVDKYGVHWWVAI